MLEEALGGNGAPADADALYILSSGQANATLRSDGCMPALTCLHESPILVNCRSGEPPSVRRVTPIECERLQGFPDDYTRIRWNKAEVEACPDRPRYHALGNSMAVPVMHHLGRRIDEVRHGTSPGIEDLASQGDVFDLFG